MKQVVFTVTVRRTFEIEDENLINTTKAVAECLTEMSHDLDLVGFTSMDSCSYTIEDAESDEVEEEEEEEDAEDAVGGGEDKAAGEEQPG